MAKLTTAARRAIPKAQFAIPEKAPASGSYPIEDKTHARAALRFSAGKPVAGRVKRAVKRAFPGMKVSGLYEAMGSSR